MRSSTSWPRPLRTRWRQKTSVTSTACPGPSPSTPLSKGRQALPKRSRNEANAVSAENDGNMAYLSNRQISNIIAMGTQPTMPESTTEFVSLDNFYNASNSNHGNIYESRLSSSSANKQLVHRAISFTEGSETVTRYLAMLQNMGGKIECSNLYLPVLCSVKPSDIRCTDFQVLNLYYEHYNTRLKDQIQARRRYREKFQEPQIWYIVYSIIKAIRMFERVCMSSGNLKTDKILLNEKGHLRVVNMLSHPEDMVGDDQGYSVQRFFAPQELRAMRERIDKRINSNVAETFAVGIIALELCTFIDGNHFYDMQRMALNDYELKRADQIMVGNYSKLLYNLVRTMLSGQYDRPLPSQIYSVFQPYENKILTLKPFNFQQMGQLNNSKVSNASLMSL